MAGSSSSSVAVVGAGAVGMTLAARLAQFGVEVEVFDALPEPARVGSRAICMQRETLEIWARIGIGERVAQRGVQWRVGRTYHRGRELFKVELPGAGSERFPPFVNISQSEVEEMLAGRLAELGVTVRWGHRLVGVEQQPDGVTAHLATADGDVAHRSFAYLAGADGAHSGVRHALGMPFPGYTFDDRFLIADIRTELPFSSERHFHFDPPWNPGRQVLIHPQPDGVWRIDWQVPAETDADAERLSGGLDRRIRAVVGSAPYELVWVTAYRFSQRLAQSFHSGRVFLAGDAAHVMSPFGARGLNSGVADAENLAWKLAWVFRGASAPSILDSYDVERRAAAVENLRVTEGTMRFMAPHGILARAWRTLVLRMASRSRWFRSRVNSGRLAEPFTYAASRIVTTGHGHAAPDLALTNGSRLRDHLGRGFVVLAPSAVDSPPDATVVAVGTESVYGDARAWIVRPDGHVADSVPLDDLAALPASLARASGAA